MKKVLIFGSTGSIGKSALEVIGSNPSRFRIVGLCAHSNIDLLRKQIKVYKPRSVCVTDAQCAQRLRKSLPSGIRLFYGDEGLREFSTLASDIAIMGICGISSLVPLLETMKHTSRVALASKEALVTAGSLVRAHARTYGTQIIPVDSEINALFQLFGCIKRSHLKKVYLTASGGPLFGYSRKQLQKVTLDKVLSHPTWRMGKRVTVDSATLVNKGFEVMEVHALFGVDYSNIGVIVHRESCIHAMIESEDNTLFACMYSPTMKIPIAHALFYPDRYPHMGKSGFPFSSSTLSLHTVQKGDFPLFDVVLKAAKRGDNFPVVINAADETAIEYFLQGRVAFYDIYKALEYIFTQTKKTRTKSVADIFYWDRWARAKTKEFLNVLN